MDAWCHKADEQTLYCCGWLGHFTTACTRQLHHQGLQPPHCKQQIVQKQHDALHTPVQCSHQCDANICQCPLSSSSVYWQMHLTADGSQSDWFYNASGIDCLMELSCIVGGSPFTCRRTSLATTWAMVLYDSSVTPAT